MLFFGTIFIYFFHSVYCIRCPSHNATYLICHILYVYNEFNFINNVLRFHNIHINHSRWSFNMKVFKREKCAEFYIRWYSFGFQWVKLSWLEAKWPFEMADGYLMVSLIIWFYQSVARADTRFVFQLRYSTLKNVFQK